MSEEQANIETMEKRENALPIRLGDGKPAFENIVEVEEHGFKDHRTVRVWFSREESGPEEMEDWVALKEYVHDHRKDETSAMQYALAVAESFPRANAVEVREGDKGCIYYPNWPMRITK